MRDVTAITFCRQAILSPELFTFANLSNRRPVASVTGAGFLTAHCRCAAGEPLTRGRPRRAGNLGRRMATCDEDGRRPLIEDCFGRSLSAGAHGCLARFQQLSATLLQA